MPGVLETLLAFDDQCRLDQGQSPTFLHRRDRRFALDQADPDPDPVRWLDHVRALTRTVTPADTRLRLWRQLRLGFVVAGALLGIVAMTGLLFYEGGQRINVTLVLGFIFLQLLLALLTSIQAVAGWQPWRPLLQRLRRRYHHPDSDGLGPLHPQLMARATHSGGLAFGITGLFTLLVLVVLQDLAFGWSTTLDTGAAGFHHLVRKIAAPWQWLWPAAVPTLELVEASRFFRVGQDTATAPARWGDWWPFVAMAWSTYVIVPRLLLLGLAGLHLRLRARRLLARHPGMTALHQRMHTPAVDTGADQTQPGWTLGPEHTAPRPPPPERALVIRWASAGTDELAAALGQPQGIIARAGGVQSLDQDRDTIAGVAGQLGGRIQAVTILTHAWEPPTAELEDFLADAFSAWPGTTTVALLPLGQHHPQAPTSRQVAQWLRFAERLGQPGLCVCRAGDSP